MKNKLKHYIILGILTLASVPSVLRAEPVNYLNSLEQVGTKVYGQEGPTDLTKVLGYVVQALLGFVGIIFLILIIWSGFQWMTSGGNEEKIKLAKKRLVNATIGLTIILMSYAIARFVFVNLSNATSAGGGGGPGAGTP